MPQEVHESNESNENGSFSSFQPNKICLLALFSHGGITKPHITNCMRFPDLFAIGESLVGLKTRQDNHSHKIAQLHANTDDVETYGHRNFLLHIVEIVTALVVGAALTLMKVWWSRRASRDLHTFTTDHPTIRRTHHGTSREEDSKDGERTGSNVEDSHEVLFKTLKTLMDQRDILTPSDQRAPGLTFS